jgi:peptidoglycan-associated lipoprotein
MQLNKIARLILVGVCILAVSACTHTKKSTGQNDEAYDDPYSHTQTSGVGQQANYNDENNPKHLSDKNVFYFDFDKSDVRSVDLPAIYAKANYLIAHPNAKLILEGHTDPRGSREYNVGLGERRANAIADILKSKGVNPSQIRIVSYGAERLAVAGHTEEEYQLDRRAIFARLQG